MRAALSAQDARGGRFTYALDLSGGSARLTVGVRVDDAISLDTVLELKRRVDSPLVAELVCCFILLFLDNSLNDILFLLIVGRFD